MNTLAIALAYLGTLAFVGWLLWLRWEGPKSLSQSAHETAVNLGHLLNRMDASVEREGALRQEVKDLRAIVDNLQLKNGLTTKR